MNSDLKAWVWITWFCTFQGYRPHTPPFCRLYGKEEKKLQPPYPPYQEECAVPPNAFCIARIKILQDFRSGRIRKEIATPYPPLSGGGGERGNPLTPLLAGGEGLMA